MSLHITKMQIFRALFKSNGVVSLFELHEKYRLPLSEMIEVIHSLESAHIAQLEEGMIKANSLGDLRVWILKNRYSIFFSPCKNEWKKVPEHFLRKAKKAS